MAQSRDLGATCSSLTGVTADKVNNYSIWSTACLFMTMAVIHNTSKLKTLL